MNRGTEQPVTTADDEIRYVGFWARVAASLVDTVLVAIVIYPLLHLVYGREYWLGEELVRGPVDFLLSWIFPAVAVVLFWISRQATPGKMLIGARIVDARTGGKPGTGQLIIRYLGYYVSAIPLFLGFVWVAIDRRKQGWHDKLAGTVVVRTSRKANKVSRSS